MAGGGWEVAAAGVGGQQVTGVGVGEQPPHPHPGALVRGQQVTGNRGGNGPVADEVGGFVVPVGQSPIGHHQMQLDADRFGFAGARG